MLLMTGQIIIALGLKPLLITGRLLLVISS